MERTIEKVFDFMGSVATGTLDFLSYMFKSNEKKTVYNADFLDERELLSRQYKGFSLTGKRCISVLQSYSHALVLGGSSSGKSSKILIPSILKMAGESSFIVNDPSSELFNKTSAFLKWRGYRVCRLNYSCPEKSEGYNPLKRATNKAKLAKIIVDSSYRNPGGDPFWKISGESLIGFFLRYLDYAPEQYRTLHNCLYLINALAHSGSDKIARLIVKTNDAELINEYKTLLSYGDKTLASIIATSKSALSFLDNEVSLTTSYDTLDFAEFRKQKTALFINNSVADMKYYSVVTSIFFEQLWAELMAKLPTDEERDLFFLIDEASSLYLGGLPTAISNLRKSRVGMMLIYQSYDQIVDMYGASQAKNIAANTYSKVYLPGQPISVAKELEVTLGKFEYTDEKDVRHIRSLMTADEIRTMQDALILCGNYPAIRTQLTPYFEQRRLKRYAQLPPLEIESVLPFTKVPLLLLDEEKAK